MTFDIITLGCKVNSCESAAIAAGMEREGFTRAEGGDAADITIVNSCAVTAAAVIKTRHVISRVKRDNPDGVAVLCGCFPQSFSEEAGLHSGADIVTGNSNKGILPDIIKEYLKRYVKTVKIEPLTREYDEGAAVPDTDRTRAFIKIEDGCDNFCAYCIIPTARGRVRSLSLERIREQAAECVKSGHKEIVLTGINLGCYGADLGLKLSDAVKACAESGVMRIRLGSLEPERLTDEEIDALRSVERLCPHFHLSLQSGSDTVLKRMNRCYDTAKFTRITNKLRESFPNCSVTTDVIVGFPGETDEEFSETLEFVQKAGFAKIHIFPYSIRRGTVAAEMKQVPPTVRSMRVDELMKLADKLELDFFGTQVNTEQTVLIEKPRSPNYSAGFTGNYTPVRIYGEPIERHSTVKVKITDYSDKYCIGRPLGG